jgi:hypothetical protein
MAAYDPNEDITEEEAAEEAKQAPKKTDDSEGLFESLAKRKANIDTASDTPSKKPVKRVVQSAEREKAEQTELEKAVPQLQAYQIKKGLTNVPEAEARFKNLQYKGAKGGYGVPLSRLSKTSAKRS